MNSNILELNRLLKMHHKKNPNSVLSIGLLQNEESYFYTFKKNDTDNVSLFGLGSVSKTILSTYMAKLISEQKLDMNKSLDQYLDLNPNICYPTVLQCATHTSGYHGFIPAVQSLSTRVFRGFNNKNLYQGLDKDWLMKRLFRNKPLSKIKYRYSDFNYAILAQVIEAIEHRPYQEAVIAFLQDEIGMMDTCYGGKEKTNELTHSWKWELENPFLAAGGLYSTPQDLVRFLNYQIQNYQGLQVSHEKHHRISSNKKIYTGFSWNSFHSGTFYWHLGGQGYYRSYVLFDTKRKLSLVILATVDINHQHVGRLGSCLYRNLKRNPKTSLDFLQALNDHITSVVIQPMERTNI